MNPVKDGLVKHPKDYKWSSYNDYFSNRNLPIVNKEFLIETFGDVNNLIEQTQNFNVKDAL
jgi:hypothetical protein